MIRIVALLVCLLPLPAFAQSAPDPSPQTNPAHQMMHMQHMMTAQPASGLMPTQPGQSAFAAIQEIVALLEADPATDWSKVNIEALRQHLIDMDNVTLRADVKSEPVEGGMRFAVIGADSVRGSVRRMIGAHVATMNGVDGWMFSSAETETGATMTVLVPAKDLVKLRGLGFIGVMARGMHHQMHHLMLARGVNLHP